MIISETETFGIVGVGIDHCEVDRMRDALARWGDRFRDRVFTEREIAYCEAFHRGREIHYAARFASKEATLKALGTGLAMGINWREIEVTRAQGKAPEVAVMGRAAEIAARLGANRFHLSVTHTRDLASAVVVGERRGLPGPNRASTN